MSLHGRGTFTIERKSREGGREGEGSKKIEAEGQKKEKEKKEIITTLIKL